MAKGLILLLILVFITNLFFNLVGKKFRFFNRKKLFYLLAYHFLFIIVYYLYAVFNRSDSKSYFERPQDISRNWFDFFGTSTTFIDFLSWPFVNFFGFNYEMMMGLFGWLGYLGFVYAYLFFRENIPIKIKVFKNFDFLTLILFLPNMHFWTASLGKGAPIFLGLMMFAYAIKEPRRRWLTLSLGSLLIYFIRPHVFLFVAVGTVLGYFSGREKISFWKKALVVGIMLGGLLIVQDQILGMAGLNNSDDLVQDFEEFSEDRAGELSKSGSGVDMTAYPLPLKLFTFWFRPLFLDAPGVLGLIVSFENLIYLLLFFKIFKKDFLKFLKKSPISVKMSAVVFLTSSFAMVFVMSNLGIMMRQKSMVMYFLFFVIYYYLAQKKYSRIMRRRRKFKKYQEMQKQLKTEPV